MTIIEKFEKITQFKLRVLLEDLSFFVKNHSSDIAEVYSNNSKVIDSTIYEQFWKLYSRIDEFFFTYSKFNQNFNNLEYWDLLEQMEEIHTFWQTIYNSPKWTRSSITTFGQYTKDSTIFYQGKQNESLNKIYRDRVGNNDSLDGWYDIAFANKLTEDEYSLAEGGVNLGLSNVSNNQPSLFLKDVVDVMSGKSAYGKDIDRVFNIDPILQDISVLTYEETIVQSIKILLSLGKEDNPYKPEDGLQKELFIGTSRGVFNIPILRRQLASIFTVDDTLTDFTITSILFEQDNIIIDATIKTVLGESISQQSLL